MFKELIFGVGNSLEKKIWEPNQKDFVNPVTVDFDPNCNPDILWDLNVRPLPFEDNEFDEIHAYEILEHLGKQGDWRGFFEEFGEYWRILKPGGVLYATCPRGDVWTWGDPGHTRVINEGTISYLSQELYKINVGKNPMTDYRHVWKKDFDPIYSQLNENTFFFALRKIVNGTDL
jgi:predicted SAM-dependent methyltransferase